MYIVVFTDFGACSVGCILAMNHFKGLFGIPVESTGLKYVWYYYPLSPINSTYMEPIFIIMVKFYIGSNSQNPARNKTNILIT